MAQWLAFSIAVAILTVLLLGLARQSQRLITDAAGGDGRTDETDERTRHDDHLGEVHSSGENTIPRQSTDGDARSHPEVAVDGEKTASEPVEADIGNREPSPARQTVELTPTALLANVAVTQGLVVVLVVAAAWYFSIPVAAFGVTDTALSTGWPAVVGGLGFGFVLWLGNEFSTTVADAVGAAYDEGVREMLAPDSPGGWVVLFAVVLPIIAFAEELLFRAALIGVPAAGFDISPWLLAVVSSLAFALGHGAQGQVGIVVTGLLGFVLAAGYIVTESLLLVVVAHYVINALEFTVHEYMGREGPFESFAAVGD